MATVNFYLDRADKEGKYFIMMTYLAQGQKFRHSVKLKAFPNQWVKRKQRVKELHREDQLVNSHLNKLESLIQDAQTHSLLFNQGIDFEFVKQLFYEALGVRKEAALRVSKRLRHKRSGHTIKLNRRLVCTTQRQKTIRASLIDFLSQLKPPV